MDIAPFGGLSNSPSTIDRNSSKVPVFNNGVIVGDKLIPFSKEIGEPILLLFTEVLNIKGFIQESEAHKYKITTVDPNLKSVSQNKLIKKLKENFQTKMIIFKGLLLDTMSNLVTMLDKSTEAYPDINKLICYFLSLKNQSGIGIHGFFLSYCINRLTISIDFYEYESKNIEWFLYMLRLKFISIEQGQMDERLKIPDLELYELLKICTEYLKKEQKLEDDNFNLLAVQLHISYFLGDFLCLELPGYKMIIPLLFEFAIWLFKNFDLLIKNSKFQEIIGFVCISIRDVKELISQELKMDFKFDHELINDNIVSSFTLGIIFKIFSKISPICYLYKGIKIKLMKGNFDSFSGYMHDKEKNGTQESQNLSIKNKKSKLLIFGNIHSFLENINFLLTITHKFIEYMIKISINQSNKKLTCQDKYHISSFSNRYYSFITSIFLIKNKTKSSLYKSKVIMELIINELISKIESKNSEFLDLIFLNLLRFIQTYYTLPKFDNPPFEILLKSFYSLTSNNTSSISTVTATQIIKLIINLILTNSVKSYSLSSIHKFLDKIKTNVLNFDSTYYTAILVLQSIIGIGDLNSDTKSKELKFTDRRQENKNKVLKPYSEFDETSAETALKINILKKIVHEIRQNEKCLNKISKKYKMKIEEIKKLDQTLKEINREPKTPIFDHSQLRDEYLKTKALLSEYRKEFSFPEKHYKIQNWKYVYLEPGVLLSLSYTESKKLIVFKRDITCKRMFILEETTFQYYKNNTRIHKIDVNDIQQEDENEIEASYFDDIIKSKFQNNGFDQQEDIDIRSSAKSQSSNSTILENEDGSPNEERMIQKLHKNIELTFPDFGKNNFKSLPSMIIDNKESLKRGSDFQKFPAFIQNQYQDANSIKKDHNKTSEASLSLPRSQISSIMNSPINKSPRAKQISFMGSTMKRPQFPPLGPVSYFSEQKRNPIQNGKVNNTKKRGITLGVTQNPLKRLMADLNLISPFINFNLGKAYITNGTQNPSKSKSKIDLSGVLSIIDQIKQKASYRVGILFCGKYQEKLQDIMSNDTKQCSPLFNKFIDKLISKNSIENGYLTTNHGLEELKYHIGPKIDKKGQKSFWVRRAVGNDPIMIVWTQNFTRLNVKSLATDFNAEIIVIQELENGLLRVLCDGPNLEEVYPYLNSSLLDPKLLLKLLPPHLISAQRKMVPLIFPALKEDYQSLNPSFNSRHKKLKAVLQDNLPNFTEVDLSFLADLFYKQANDTFKEKQRKVSDIMQSFDPKDKSKKERYPYLRQTSANT